MRQNLALAIILFSLLAHVGCNAQSNKNSSEELPFRPIRLPASHPVMPVIADVNNDRDLDILVANNSGSLSVYLGDGKGGFTQTQGSPFPAGEEPTDIAVADLNGDGNLDVAIANHGVKTVTILLGDGKGKFSLAPKSPFGVDSNPHPHGIAAADFNRDGKTDLVVDSWGENKVLVLLGRGDGTLQAPGTKFDTGKMPYQRLRVADMNNDGNPDIITSNFESSSASVLLGNGKGGFARKDFSTPPSPFGIAIADVNGDKHLDIVISHYSGHATDTSKNAMSVLLGGGKEDFTLARGSPFSTGNYPGTVAAGDLSGDGIADIVIPIAEEGILTVYLCTSTAVTLAPYSPVRVGRSPHGVAIADLDHDGKGDIVVAEEQDNDVLVLLRK